MRPAVFGGSFQEQVKVVSAVSPQHRPKSTGLNEVHHNATTLKQHDASERIHVAPGYVLRQAPCQARSQAAGTTSGPPRELSVAPSCDRGRLHVAVAVYIHVMHVMHGVERMHGLVEKRMTATLRQIENGLTASGMMHSGAGHQQSITRRRAW